MANQRVVLTDSPQDLKDVLGLTEGSTVWFQVRNGPIFHYEEAAQAPVGTGTALRIPAGEFVKVRVGAEGVWVWSDGTVGAVAVVAPGV